MPIATQINHKRIMRNERSQTRVPIVGFHSYKITENATNL